MLAVVGTEHGACPARQMDEATDGVAGHVVLLVLNCSQQVLVVVEDHWRICSGHICIRSCPDVLSGLSCHSLSTHVLNATICSQLEHCGRLLTFIRDSR